MTSKTKVLEVKFKLEVCLSKIDFFVSSTHLSTVLPFLHTLPTLVIHGNLKNNYIYYVFAHFEANRYAKRCA